MKSAELKYKILIIGERSLHETVKRCLPDKEEIAIACCNTEEKAQENFSRQAPDLVVADLICRSSSRSSFSPACLAPAKNARSS